MIITGKKFSKPDLSRVINGDTEIKGEETSPEKMRLDHLLVQQYPDYNRSSLQKFTKAGYVTVDGKVTTKPNALIAPNAKIELTVPEMSTEKVTPPVIYEDANVIVLDKPAGLLSMAKGEYCPEPTLEDYGLLVHRLDRDTSGVVILAKNPETQSMLRKQFQDRKTHKTYYAIVEGRPKHNEAVIDLPIARNLKHPTTFQVDQNGKPAQTYYRVLASNDKYSLLELKPKTGRTHQLRVHLKHLGTPIVGDVVYGSEKYRQLQHSDQKDKHNLQPKPRIRLFLHAGSLEITIPGEPTNQRKVFESPIPNEFTDFFKPKGN